MKEFIESLNANSGALNLVFSLIVAVATLFYVILTRSLVKETKRMREAQTEPHVAAKVELTDEWIHFIMFAVENVGVGPAYNIKLTIKPDFITDMNRPLSSIGMFKHGISYLAPGQRLSIYLTSLLGKIDEIEKPDSKYKFTVHINYESSTGVKYSNTYPIDFLQFMGMSRIGTPPMRSIAGDIEKIRDSVGKIQSGWNKLKVEIYDSKDRKMEVDKWKREQRELIAQQKKSSLNVSSKTKKTT